MFSFNELYFEFNLNKTIITKRKIDKIIIFFLAINFCFSIKEYGYLIKDKFIPRVDYIEIINKILEVRYGQTKENC